MKAKALFAVHTICTVQIILATVFDAAKRSVATIEIPAALEMSAMPFAATIMFSTALITAMVVKKQRANECEQVMPKWMVLAISHLTLTATAACMIGMIL